MDGPHATSPRMQHDTVVVGELIEGSIEFRRGAAEARLQFVSRRNRAAVDERAKEFVMKEARTHGR